MSPRSAAQFEEIREQSRERILNAALALFANKGYASTSILDIARTAGVSKGLMYNYFDSKQELIMAVILREMDATTPLMAELEAAETPAERLRIMLDLSLRMMRERLDHAKLLLKLSMQMEDIPELTPIVRGKYTAFMPYLAQQFREMGYDEPEQEAAALAALLDGMLIQHITVGDLMDFEGMRHWILKRYSLG